MKGYIALAALLAGAMPAQAACVDEIRQVFEARSTQQDVRVLIETRMNDQVVQTTNGWILDHRHNMYEVVGRNWWSMLNGDTHYNSTDGKTWTKSGQNDPDWEAKAAAARENILTTMTDVSCGDTEEIDGRTYHVYRYSHAAEKPYPTSTDNLLYFDPEAGFVYRTVSHNRLAGGGTTVMTYTPGVEIEFPTMD